MWVPATPGPLAAGDRLDALGARGEQAAVAPRVDFALHRHHFGPKLGVFAHHQHSLRRSSCRRSEDPLAARLVERHRLLQQHVLARAQRLHRQTLVQVVGHQDDHRVEARVAIGVRWRRLRVTVARMLAVAIRGSSASARAPARGRR